MHSSRSCVFIALFIGLSFLNPAHAFDADPSGASDTPSSPLGTAPVGLVLDDGSSENTIGDSGQFLWVNRFTPDTADLPFQIEQIEVQFGSTMVSAGDAIELLVYSDTDGDGDPGTGSILLAQFSETIQSPGSLNTYSLATPVRIDGPGDVLVGVINRYGSEGFNDFPAAIDQTTSEGRSWAGSWSSGDAPATPTLPADEQWGTIDSFGFPGNWIIRATGTGIIDSPFTTAVVNETPTSLPVSDPAYSPDGAFDIEITDGSCTGTYSVAIAPVVGSAPDGTTPPATTPANLADVSAGSHTFNDAGAGDYDVTVNETSPCDFDPGVDPNEVTATVGFLEAGLTASTATLDFGSLLLNVTSAPQTLTLTSNGQTSVSISAVTGIAAPFAQSGGDCPQAPFSLAETESCTLEITFTPTSQGPATADLAIESTDSESPLTITLSGYGAGFPVPILGPWSLVMLLVLLLTSGLWGAHRQFRQRC